MLHAQTLADNSVLGRFLKMGDLEFKEIETTIYPEPDYSLIDKYTINVKQAIKTLGEIESLSDENREILRRLSARVFKVLSRFEKDLNHLKRLPEHVSWKQKAHNKLEDLVILLEDLVEMCALSASKEFAQIIEGEIKSLSNASLES